VRRLGALVAALAALLAFAPAALAATYVVTDPGDADIATADCTTPGSPTCTLRAAIQTANANPGADEITFGAGVAPTGIGALNSTTAPSSAVTEAVTIDGGAGTTVTFDALADGPLLQVPASGTTIENMTFGGGKSGPVLQFQSSGASADHVTVQDAPGDGFEVAGIGARLSAVSATNTGAAGIVLSGADAALSSPVVVNAGGHGIVVSGSHASVSGADVSASDGDGIAVTGGSGSRISGGHLHGNSGNGIRIAAQNTVVSRVVVFGNARKPIALAPGANGGIAAPHDLRIGPRRADGSLPLTGQTGGGSVELWSGSPFGPIAPVFTTAFGVSPGGFTYNFPSEPAPGTTFALDVTAGGTSEYSLVSVPPDVVSPDIVRARALSTTDVRVVPSEPIDAGSLQPDDFTLTMAGQDRQVAAASLTPDGSEITLTSSGWKAGEAGYVTLKAAGAVADTSGNASLATTRLRVAAAPGDFLAPIAGRLKLLPKNMCLTHARRCRRTGTRIRFETSEPGKARIVVQRGNKRIGSRLYGNVAEGMNTLGFNGRLGGRKLRAGRYRLLVYVQDLVGNVTDQPPIALLGVRRVTR
jgi:CSLREA domain-containing protein